MDCLVTGRPGAERAWAVCLDVGRQYAGVVTRFKNPFAIPGGFLGPLVAGPAIER